MYNEEKRTVKIVVSEENNCWWETNMNYDYDLPLGFDLQKYVKHCLKTSAKITVSPKLTKGGKQT